MLNAASKSNIILFGLGIKHSVFFKISTDKLFLLDKRIRDYSFSEKCCDFVKGGLKHDKRPAFVGVMATESINRRQSWFNDGCNIFKKGSAKSRPLSIWNQKNVWEYLTTNNIPINPCYGYNGDINNLRFTRLGCSGCPLGSQFEEFVHKKILKENETISPEKKHWNRFEKLKDFNPNLYQSQIIKTGIYKIVADMNVQIRNDENYMEYYKQRRIIIDNWYKDLKNNLLNVAIQLEKGSKQKKDWIFTDDELNKMLTSHKLPELNEKDKLLIKKIRQP